MAINDAIATVRQHGDLPVPLHIRNAPTKLMKNMGYGKNYKYSHNYENNFLHRNISPSDIAGSKFYDPGRNAREEELRRYLKKPVG